MAKTAKKKTEHIAPRPDIPPI
jgi:hypothetical protein